MKERVIYTSEVPKGMTPRQRKKFVRKIRAREAKPLSRGARLQAQINAQIAGTAPAGTSPRALTDAAAAEAKAGS